MMITDADALFIFGRVPLAFVECYKHLFTFRAYVNTINGVAEIVAYMDAKDSYRMKVEPHTSIKLNDSLHTRACIRLNSVTIWVNEVKDETEDEDDPNPSI